MKLGEMVLKLSKERGWSLSRLAREAGVAKPTLHGWTTGRNALNPEQLKRVATALEVSIHELLFGEPDPFESKSHEVLRELFKGDVRVTVHKIERRRD